MGVAVAVAGDTGGFGSATAEVGMNTVPAAMARALMARTGPALRLRLTIIMFPLFTLLRPRFESCESNCQGPTSCSRIHAGLDLRAYEGRLSCRHGKPL